MLKCLKWCLEQSHGAQDVYWMVATTEAKVNLFKTSVIKDFISRSKRNQQRIGNWKDPNNMHVKALSKVIQP